MRMSNILILSTLIGLGGGLAASELRANIKEAAPRESVAKKAGKNADPVSQEQLKGGCLRVKHIRNYNVSDEGDLIFTYRLNKPIKVHFEGQCNSLRKTSVVAYGNPGLGYGKLCTGALINVSATSALGGEQCTIAGFSDDFDFPAADDSQ